MNLLVYVHMYICISMYVYVDTYVHMYLCMYVCIYLYMYICVYTVYCKSFEVEKFHGWTSQFQFAGNHSLPTPLIFKRKCAHMHVQLYTREMPKSHHKKAFESAMVDQFEITSCYHIYQDRWLYIIGKWLDCDINFIRRIGVVH